MTEERGALALPEKEEFIADIKAINEFQRIVHECLISGQDFGVIPGTTKPTLLKPGAEKIAKLLGLADHYELVDRQEEWDPAKPLFRYLIRCRLVHLGTGAVISEGLGECNSMEAKYRWRESKRKCPECGTETIIKGKEEWGGGWLCFKKMGGCGYKWPDGAPEIENQKIGRVENEDIYSQVNTILKMAKKRALVDAALSAGRLSNVFTQDIEDTGGTGETTPPKQPEEEKPSLRKPPEKPADVVAPVTPPPSEKPLGIDRQWLDEALKKTKWGDNTLKSWLRSKANYLGLDMEGTIYDIIARMSPAQKEFLEKELKERLGMA